LGSHDGILHAGPTTGVVPGADLGCGFSVTRRAALRRPSLPAVESGGYAAGTAGALVCVV
jgi:hypothetical protein